LIQRENARGIPTDAIVLAGFSQGAVVALTTGLHYSQPLAGIMALSAPVIAADRLASEIHPANAATPIFLAHGRRDALVPFSLGERLSRVLGGAGLPLAWHDYPMEHSVCLDEVRDIAIWLRGVLPSR
jgi:phospholipase/carboxylesterase